MGYLDNSSVTIDAVLTKKGRELLARGQNEFNITHYALADDEIDYDLYNTDHPLGTAYYGAAIENHRIIDSRFNHHLLRYDIGENTLLGEIDLSKVEKTKVSPMLTQVFWNTLGIFTNCSPD